MSMFQSCCLFQCRLWIYLLVGSFCNLMNMWSWMMEPHGNKCKFKPIGGNNTGMKALAYGHAKTGTTTMARIMFDVGLKSYHSEDFKFHVWTPLADIFYQRPENGAKLFGMSRLATPWAPAYKGHSLLFRGGENGSDMKVLRGISSEDLAAAVSKCRVDAMVFDGLEQLFEPMYKLSPHAKIIVLDWRTYDQYWTSLKYFTSGQWSGLLALSFFVVSMHILPWNAFVFPYLDPLFGGPIEDLMRNGKPFHTGTLGNRESPLAMLWRMQLTERRIMEHRMSGLVKLPIYKQEYTEYWDWVKTHVPAERRFHWNMRKHGYADLCKFLNIKGNPICNKEGPIKYKGISVMNQERENPKSFFIVCCYLLFLHYLSYNIFWCIVPLLYRNLMKPLKLFLPGFNVKVD